MIDYTAIGVWTGVVTAIIGLITWMYDRAQGRKSMRLETLRCLAAEFHNLRMFRNRRKAAEAFKSGEIKSTNNAIDEIVDFFEEVAYYEEIKAIRATDAWSCFFSYMYRFCHFAKKYIDNYRQVDPTVWLGFIVLFQKLHGIELKELKKRNKKAKRLVTQLSWDLPKDCVDRFLDEELNLCIDQ